MPRFVFKLEPVLKQRTAIEREKQLVVAHLESQRIELETTIKAAQGAIDASRNELRELLGNASPNASSISHPTPNHSSSGGEGPGSASTTHVPTTTTKIVNLFGARLQAASTLQASVSAQRAVIKLAGIFTKLQAARADLANAMKRRRAVELLKEARFEEWKRELQRKDSEMLDEVGTRIASENLDT